MSEVLTVKEAKAYLKVPQGQIYDLVNSGAVKAFRIGKHIRIPKENLETWIKTQIMNF